MSVVVRFSPELGPWLREGFEQVAEAFFCHKAACGQKPCAARRNHTPRLKREAFERQPVMHQHRFFAGFRQRTQFFIAARMAREERLCVARLLIQKLRLDEQVTRVHAYQKRQARLARGDPADRRRQIGEVRIHVREAAMVRYSSCREQIKPFSNLLAKT